MGRPRLRISPRVLPLVLLGGALLLSILGTAAGFASFILLRAGYGFVVYGLLPPLLLLLFSGVLVVIVWRAVGGPRPGGGRDHRQEGPKEPGEEPGRGGPRGGDGV